MWPDEDGNWSIYGSDATAAPEIAPVNGSGSWTDAFTTAADFAKNVFGTVATVDQYLFNRQVGQVQLQTAKSNLNTASYVEGIKGQIAMKQADAALATAQRQVDTAAGLYDSGGMATLVGNFQRQLQGLGSSNSMMLWLTVAGVAIAYLQFSKKK